MVTVNVYGRPLSKAIQEGIKSKDERIFGFGFPLGKRLSGPAFYKAADVDLIKNNLYQLLGTDRGERVMLPNYGMNLRRYLFEPLDEITFEKIKMNIVSNIAQYLPQLKLLRLGVFKQDGDVGFTGLPGFEIKLILQLKDNTNVIFDTQVEIR